MAIRIEDLAELDFTDVSDGERTGPVTPGDVLWDEFMLPLGLTGRGLAREIGVPTNRVTQILAGIRAITPDTALLLAERFGTSAEFWLNLQMMHDLEEARARHKVTRITSRKLRHAARQQLKPERSTAPVTAARRAILGLKSGRVLRSAQVCVFGWKFRSLAAAMAYYGVKNASARMAVRRRVKSGEPCEVLISGIARLMEQGALDERMRRNSEAGLPKSALPLNPEQGAMTPAEIEVISRHRLVGAPVAVGRAQRAIPR